MRTVLFYLCCAAVVLGLLCIAMAYVPPFNTRVQDFISLFWKPWVIVLLGIIGIFASNRKI